MPLQEMADLTAAWEGWRPDKDESTSQDCSEASVTSSDHSVVWPPPGLRPVLLATVVAVFNFVKRNRKFSRIRSRSCRNTAEGEQAPHGGDAVDVDYSLPGLVQFAVVEKAGIEGDPCNHAKGAHQSIGQWAHHQAHSSPVLNSSSDSTDPRPVFSDFQADGAASAQEDNVRGRLAEELENASGPTVPIKHMDDSTYSQPLQDEVLDQNVRATGRALHADNPENAHKENAAIMRNRSKFRPGLLKELRSVDNEFANPTVLDRFESHKLSPARGLVDIINSVDAVEMTEISFKSQKRDTEHENMTKDSLSSKF
jgi:hypothetical protein